MEVTHLGCAIEHQLEAGFLLMHSEVDPVRRITRGIHRLSPEPSRSPMLIKHRPSHLTQGSVLPFRNTRRLRKISSKHLTLGNDHTYKVPSRVQNPRSTRPKQYLKTLIQQLGHRKQIVSKLLNKSNTLDSDLVTHLNLTF
jgi:hypothetical protein